MGASDERGRSKPAPALPAGVAAGRRHAVAVESQEAGKPLWVHLRAGG